MEETGSIRLRVNCSDCGDVNVTADEVTIRNCIDTDGWSYAFSCPNCHVRDASATSRRAALAAMSAGAAMRTWRLPAELAERPAGPPLTVVDLLELRLMLTEPDFIEQLAG
jgi:hypothetical protein